MDFYLISCKVSFTKLHKSTVCNVLASVACLYHPLLPAEVLGSPSLLLGSSPWGWPWVPWYGTPGPLLGLPGGQGGASHPLLPACLSYPTPTPTPTAVPCELASSSPWALGPFTSLGLALLLGKSVPEDGPECAGKASTGSVTQRMASGFFSPRGTVLLMLPPWSTGTVWILSSSSPELSSEVLAAWETLFVPGLSLSQAFTVNNLLTSVLTVTLRGTCCMIPFSG